MWFEDLLFVLSCQCCFNNFSIVFWEIHTSSMQKKLVEILIWFFLHLLRTGRNVGSFSSMKTNRQVLLDEIQKARFLNFNRRIKFYLNTKINEVMKQWLLFDRKKAVSWDKKGGHKQQQREAKREVSSPIEWYPPWKQCRFSHTILEQRPLDHKTTIDGPYHPQRPESWRKEWEIHLLWCNKLNKSKCVQMYMGFWIKWSVRTLRDSRFIKILHFNWLRALFNSKSGNPLVKRVNWSIVNCWYQLKNVC